MYFKICLILVFFTGKLLAQEPKAEHRTLEAKRTSSPVKIDGLLDEAAWQDAAKADDFTEFRPIMGRKWTEQTRTETYLMYNDEGIYFGGHCYEATPDSIARELAGRDGFRTNDYIGLIFDTYQDKINGFEYFVTPLNEQWDAKTTNGDEDFSWNAVWTSGARIHDKGWDFEMFIPYAAIRFGKKEVQNWGLNITRRRRKTEQQNSWNFVNINTNGWLTQAGTWQGLTNIKPPFRLQLYPYLSYYQNHYPANVSGQSNWSNQVAGGLDLKMGLSQSFTLDATLIPDFGQVQSDNRVLNLSPFEVKYNEYRNFFTEGTELFSKGDLFYSRRIGGSPINAAAVYNNLAENETISHNPAESKLINATKISGRTQKGLGIGILNAITKPTLASIYNEDTQQSRTVETDPLTNYSIFVLDQNLKYNSNVSFINTSVLRQGDFYNAQVSQVMTNLNDKKNIYGIQAAFASSYLNFKKAGEEDSRGFKYNIGFSKNSGKFTFGLQQERTDTKFTSNDLGYFTNNNYLDHNMYFNYRERKPKGIYNMYFINGGAWTSHLAKKIEGIDEIKQRSGIRLNAGLQTKTLHFIGLFNNFQFKHFDFYEPRVSGQYFERGGRYMFGTWLESNSAKKYSVFYEMYKFKFFNFYNTGGSGIDISNNYRFNTRISLNLRVNWQYNDRQVGFATMENDQPIFAVRKVRTFDNVLSTKYNFNNKNWLTLRIRHYNSEVHNIDFFNLLPNAKLQAREPLNKNVDYNVNYFNVDMVYTWQFAPGSFFNVVWKNNTYKSINQTKFKYFNDLDQTLGAEQNNNISFKLIYFLDYQSLRRKTVKN